MPYLSMRKEGQFILSLFYTVRKYNKEIYYKLLFYSGTLGVYAVPSGTTQVPVKQEVIKVSPLQATTWCPPQDS